MDNIRTDLGPCSLRITGQPRRNREIGVSCVRRMGERVIAKDCLLGRNETPRVRAFMQDAMKCIKRSLRTVHMDGAHGGYAIAQHFRFEQGTFRNPEHRSRIYSLSSCRSLSGASSKCRTPSIANGNPMRTILITIDHAHVLASALKRRRRRRRIRSVASSAEL